MVLCRILPCVTGVKRGRVDPGARERQEGEVRSAVPPPPLPVPLLSSPSRAISLSFSFGTPDVQDSKILVIASGIENKTTLHEGESLLRLFNGKPYITYMSAHRIAFFERS